MKRYAKKDDCFVFRRNNKKEEQYFDIPKYGDHEVMVNDS